MATTKIIENKRLTPYILKMVIQGEQISYGAKPGQFVNLKIGSGYHPLLRRPMSIYHAEGAMVEIIYNIRGFGTRLLSTYQKGDAIDVLGPLGVPFDSLLEANRCDEIYLVAGGMGVAPLHFFYKKRQAKVIMGARDRDRLIPFEEFDLDNCISITEDGSIGKKGLVTDYLPNISDSSTLIACGPVPMLERIKTFYSKSSVRCILSLEARMGCGFGSCLSCAVRTKQGYKYVCKDGPAFLAEDLIFD